MLRLELGKRGHVVRETRLPLRSRRHQFFRTKLVCENQDETYLRCSGPGKLIHFYILLEQRLFIADVFICLLC